MTRPASIDCEWCGVPVVVARDGRIPRFCGDKCRKASYGRNCIDCGTRTDGSNGRDKSPKRCRACHGTHEHAQARERIIAAMHEWHAVTRRPPSATDWNEGHDKHRPKPATTYRDWPHTSNVQGVFGSWNAAIEAAGFDVLPAGLQRDPEAHRIATSVALREHFGTEERRQRIADLYLSGMPLARIGEVMGSITDSCVALHLRAMRDEGWDLPYRHPWSSRERIAV